MTGQPLYQVGLLYLRILFVFPSSLLTSFPSSNLKYLTKHAFLKQMKSVHSTSNKWKHTTVFQDPARTLHPLETLSLISLIHSSLQWLLLFLNLHKNTFCNTFLALKVWKIISEFNCESCFSPQQDYTHFSSGNIVLLCYTFCNI